MVCTARAPRCALPAGAGCALARARRGRRRAAAARRRERFEDTNRWVRGRVVAALAAGEGCRATSSPERLERAVDGLVRDGSSCAMAGAFR